MQQHLYRRCCARGFCVDARKYNPVCSAERAVVFAHKRQPFSRNTTLALPRGESCHSNTHLVFLLDLLWNWKSFNFVANISLSDVLRRCLALKEKPD